MKLRNKKTGKIIKLDIHCIAGKVYETLAKINEEWEDYEEPKEHWFIDYDGGIVPFNRNKETATDRMMEQIGNYFETKEEAEKAVEKLKAVKRLKDTYFIKFDLDFVKNTIKFTYRIDGTLHSAVNEEHIVFEDMKTIFGGEE